MLLRYPFQSRVNIKFTQFVNTSLSSLPKTQRPTPSADHSLGLPHGTSRRRPFSPTAFCWTTSPKSSVYFSKDLLLPDHFAEVHPNSASCCAFTSRTCRTGCNSQWNRWPSLLSINVTNILGLWNHSLLVILHFLLFAAMDWLEFCQTALN